MIRVLLVAFIAVFAGELLAAPAKNVVVIVADDLGFQLGCYGDPLSKTPYIDRLAADGTRFTRAYCTTASCSASRSVILTGQYNHAIAHYGHEHGEGHFSTYDNVLTLPVLLSRAGYRTCSVGKYHVAPEKVYHFDAYNGGKKNRNDAPTEVAMAASAWSFIAEDDPRPFFLYYCPTEPHRANDPSGFHNTGDEPGIKPHAYSADDVALPAWLPDLPEARQEWAQFLGAIARLDQKVGALVDVLKATGHYDDTLIFFLSDNGPPFPGAKTTHYEPGVNLPLIVKLPGQQARGITSDARVTWADLTPTIIEYAGASAPPRVGKGKQAARPPFDGRSMLGIIEQQHPDGWDRVFLSHTFHEITMYYPMRTLIDGRYKYIFNIAHPLPYPFASDLYASRTWQAALKRDGDPMYGLRRQRDYLQRPRHELYDLEADPGETHNLAGDPQHASRLAEMQEQVRTFQSETRDPWVTKWVYE
ncbi:MAG TPA: sulfatase [Pirellulales bacterium]|nr:sulfatase [Pirellulales bacterium]